MRPALAARPALLVGACLLAVSLAACTASDTAPPQAEEGAEVTPFDASGDDPSGGVEDPNDEDDGSSLDASDDAETDEEQLDGQPEDGDDAQSEDTLRDTGDASPGDDTDDGDAADASTSEDDGDADEEEEDGSEEPDASLDGTDAEGDAPSVCLPACEDRTCGSDGCGGVCGRCEFGERCTNAGRCESILPRCGDGLVRGEETCDPGPDRIVEGCLSNCQVAAGWTCSGEPSECTQRDLEESGTLCSRPIPVDGGKFYGRLDLAGQFNSYTPWMGECRDGVFGTRSSGPDLTFSVDVRAGDSVRARAKSGFTPMTIVIATACGEDDPVDYVLNESCVAIAQTETLNNWIEVTWTAEEDGVLFVVVGAIRSFSTGGAFDLSIDVQ